MKQVGTKPTTMSGPGTGETGFSLVEIMVALLVGAIVIAGMYQGFSTLQKWLVSGSVRSDMRQNARAGLETLTRDIEMAGYQTSSYGDLNKTGLAITLATEHEIEMDQQRVEHTSGSVDWANPAYEPRLVYYHLATDMRTGRQNLYRQIRTQPGLRSTDEIVAENVSNFTVAYLDKNNNPVDCLTEIFRHNKLYGEYTFGMVRPRVDADYCRAPIAPCTTRLPCNSGLHPDPLKNIRRITVSLTTVPAGATTLASAATAGAASIEVASTNGFPPSGKLDVFTISGMNVVGVTPVSYSGKDATHFTGCDGVPAADAGSVVSRAMPIGRAVKPFSLSASVMPQNLDAADEATPDCAPPAVPTGLAVIDTRSCTGKLSVKWNANADLDLDGYKLFYGPTDFVKVPVSRLADKNNPQFTLNAECLLITKQPDKSTKPNTYAIQIVAYDVSGNDSEKSVAVTGNPSTDVTAFGGDADTTVNPLKPSPPPRNPPVTGPRLTVTHVPGWRFAVSSPPPLADWTPTKLFILPGRPLDVSVLSKAADWGGTWPDCLTYPFALDVYPPASFCPSNVCCENDERWSECSEPGDNWPNCPSWLDCPGWPDCPNRSCWPDYNYYYYRNDAYMNCALCNEPPGVAPKASQVVSTVAAQGALVLTWKPADSATTGYRVYRSPKPFVNGAHIDGSLQIASSTLIDRVSRALYPDDPDAPVPVVPKPTWIDWVDTKQEGCLTYHYAVASVNCDETLVDGYLYNDDPELSDYAYANWTTPFETTPPPPPGLEVSDAGEQWVHITLTNPLSTDAAAADFARTEIHWSRSTTASLSDPLIPNIELINGVPGTPGAFEKRGSQVIVFDRETAMNPPLSLVAGATYSFLAVSYDHCGNASTATSSVALPAPAIDFPVGPPLAPTPFPTAPLKACEADRVELRWAYIDPPEDDFAGFLVTRSKNGGVGVELADGPTTSLSWTDAGDDLPGRKLEAGAEYTYTIAAADRVWEAYLSDPVVPPYLDPLNTLTIGPVHPGGLRRYEAPTGGPEHFTTTLSDGMVAGSPWTYTYHNNVKFWLQNTSRSPVTIKEIAITWQDNKFTREDGKEHIYDIVLDSVIIGGPPSSTAAHTPDIRSADTAKVSTTLKTGVAGVLGKVWYVTFDPALPIVDHATSTGVASGAIPVQLRFTNCDTTVNRDTDMRNGTLGVYLWVEHSFDDPTDCTTLTNITIDVPRGPELGCFSQSAPGSYGVASFEVIGRPIKSDRENDLTIPTGNRVDDLKISTGIGVNIHGRKVLDNSREVYPDGVNKGFDVLKVYGVNAAAANPAAVPVMPTPSTFERPLQFVSGDRYALSLSSPPVAGELMPQDANKVHWYFALAVDKTGNWDRVPSPPVPAVPPDPPVLPESNNYAYFQETFDVCSVTPKAPDQAAATKVGNDVLVTWCAPTAYVNDAPLRADDKISYDVEFSADGGANWQADPIRANLASRSYTHSGLAAGTYVYRVRAKNSCMTCTSCPSSCCGVYAVTSSVVM